MSLVSLIRPREKLIYNVTSFVDGLTGFNVRVCSEYTLASSPGDTAVEEYPILCLYLVTESRDICWTLL